MAPMVAAAQALLQFLTENQADGADNVGVGVVNHNGIRTRALTASKAFQKGDVVLASSPAHVLHRQDVHGRRFEGCNDDACKVALYIAEQRAQASKDVASIDPYWQKAMSTFPSFSDFESLGMPLAASEKALTVLSQIPELQTFVHFIRHTRGTMLSAVDFYNRNSESHLSFADALWGRLVAESSMESSCGLHVAPVADWVNHSRTPNVSYHCDDGNVTLSALQSISPGHELQAEYNQSGPLANFARYGIIEDASSTKPLSPSSCTRLQLLSSDKEPVLRTASRFASIHCGQPLTPTPSGPSEVVPTKEAVPTVEHATRKPMSASVALENGKETQSSDPTSNGLQWGSLQLQPLTQIPGVSNLLYGPRPYVPLSPSAWDATLPMMMPTMAANMSPEDVIALDVWIAIRSKKVKRAGEFLVNADRTKKNAYG